MSAKQLETLKEKYGEDIIEDFNKLRTHHYWNLSALASKYSFTRQCAYRIYKWMFGETYGKIQKEKRLQRKKDIENIGCQWNPQRKVADWKDGAMKKGAEAEKLLMKICIEKNFTMEFDKNLKINDKIVTVSTSLKPYDYWTKKKRKNKHPITQEEIFNLIKNSNGLTRNDISDITDYSYTQINSALKNLHILKLIKLEKSKSKRQGRGRVAGKWMINSEEYTAAIIRVEQPAMKFRYGFTEHSFNSDFFICYHPVENGFFIIPTSILPLENKNKIMIYINERQSKYHTAKNAYWEYLNAWHLLERSVRWY